MKKYDIVVIGSGCGLNIVEEAITHGLKVALVDKGPLGGTCLNLGCIPSKMLIYVADRIVDIQEATRFGIEVDIKTIDFKSIMARMSKSIQEDQAEIREGIKQSREMDFYEGEGHFTEQYTIEVNNEKIRGEKIFIASGSRPFIPPIKGLTEVDYLTSETILRLEDRPQSLIVIGGGYIGVEYGHFFAAMGTRTTIIEMADRLILSEEPEISALLKSELSTRMDVYTSTQIEEIKKRDGGVNIILTDRNTGKQRELTAEKIMVAVGRRSNADLLKVENTGVETDEKGFVKVDSHLETTQKNIFAIGDANGRQMFTHMANRQAMIAGHNAIHDASVEMDFTITPHAVYSHPQIASIGLTEEKARKDHKILVGQAEYLDIAKGEAMMETKGFAKAIVEQETEKILGFHIIGPNAPELIQEVINTIVTGGLVEPINAGIHIHPALPELVQRALGNLRTVD